MHSRMDARQDVTVSAYKFMSSMTGMDGPPVSFKASIRSHVALQRQHSTVFRSSPRVPTGLPRGVEDDASTLGSAHHDSQVNDAVIVNVGRVVGASQVSQLYCAAF